METGLLIDDVDIEEGALLSEIEKGAGCTVSEASWGGLKLLEDITKEGSQMTDSSISGSFKVTRVTRK